MNPSDYQRLAMRTEANQRDIVHRIYVIDQTQDAKATRLSNAVRGLSDDAGEVNAAVKKWLEYGQELDEINLLEEVGDCLWRLAQVCDAIGATLDDAMVANIKKLQQRYPETYSDTLAKEENRDRDKEREAVKASGDQKDLAGAASELTITQATAISKAKVAARSVINREQNGQGWAEPPEQGEIEITHTPEGSYISKFKPPGMIEGEPRTFVGNTHLGPNPFYTDELFECPTCDGAGDILVVKPGGSIGGGSCAECPSCNGTGKVKDPWNRPNTHGERPGDICCQRATGNFCYEHNPLNYIKKPQVEDGWTVARRIASLFNSPTEQRFALGQINQAEAKYKEHHAKG